MLVCIYMFKFRKFLYTLWSTNIDCHSIKLYKNLGFIILFIAYEHCIKFVC